MNEIYQFQEKFEHGRSPIWINVGDEKFIRRYIKIKEFNSLFGGFLRLETNKGEKYLGVWSKRNSSKFRRILRERGANIQLKEEIIKNVKWVAPENNGHYEIHDT